MRHASLYSKSLTKSPFFGADSLSLNPRYGKLAPDGCLQPVIICWKQITFGGSSVTQLVVFRCPLQPQISRLESRKKTERVFVVRSFALWLCFDVTLPVWGVRGEFTFLWIWAERGAFEGSSGIMVFARPHPRIYSVCCVKWYNLLCLAVAGCGAVGGITSDIPFLAAGAFVLGQRKIQHRHAKPCLQKVQGWKQTIVNIFNLL